MPGRMPALLAALTAVSFLACTIGDAPDTNTFRGETGNFNDEGGLGEFLDEHVGSIVTLDIRIPAAAYTGGEHQDFTFFTVFEYCPDEDWEDRKNVAGCEGTEYHVLKSPGSPRPVREGAAWRLKGRFRPHEPTGPYQGLFVMVLEPAGR